MDGIKMSKEDYLDWTEFRGKNSSTIYKPEIDLLVNLHAKYFNHKVYYPCSCSPKTYNSWISDLNKIYENGVHR